MPGLISTLATTRIIIQAGSVSYQAIGLGLASFDLFAHGFGGAIQAGAPLTITFQVTDTVVADNSLYGNNVHNSTEHVNLGDRRLIWTVRLNDLTLETSEIPEPLTTVLIGGGLLSFALALRYFSRSRPPAG